MVSPTPTPPKRGLVIPMPNITQLRKTYPPHLSVSDLDILLSSTLKKPKEFIFAHPEYPISIIQYLRFRWFIHRYRQGYSVAAITHHKEFFDLDFYVNRHTLIPRPETEMMVEEVIEKIKKTTNQKNILIDVGTGSGCIPIAINKTIKQCNNKTITTLAIDISRPALRVAHHNARTHNVFINFLHGNLLEPLLTNSELRTKNSELVIITANLPYLTHEQFASEPSVQREPYSALVAEKTGLALYEKLLQQFSTLITKYLISNIQYYLFFEIDPSQSSAITLLIKNHLPHASVEIKKDLARRDRLVAIQINRKYPD